ncbi:MAG: hypothetical protein C0518_13460 [Opitutus sp.]|nr:hypothetical protein [Opitutus sp.]
MERGLNVPPILFEHLNPDFVTLYELTRAEVEHLESVLSRARNQVAELEVEKARISPQSDGTIRVTIDPFPDQGGVILDTVRAEIFATLGAERSEFFRRLSDFDGADSTEFGGFGLRRTIIEIRPGGVHGDASASSTTSIDPATKVQTLSVQTDLPTLKQLQPALHIRIVGSTVR